VLARIATGGSSRPPQKCEEVGLYDEHNGELRLSQRGASLLEAWIGRRLSRDELEARDNRTSPGTSATADDAGPVR
jgi:hypothetical protein